MQRNPTIASKDDGDTTAAWVDLRSNQTNIWSSTLVNGTGSWTANTRVTDNTSALKDFPDLAMDSAGVSYAVWQDSRSGNADIFFSTLAAGGASWAANVKISDDAGTSAQTKPRIGVDSAGNLTAAWIDARTSPARVRVARKPAAGAWSASIEISPAPANVQSLALSVRPDGFAWAVWGDTRAGAANQDIWGSRYDPSLNAWSAAVRLDDDPGTTANQLSPTVAIGAAETMLSWRDNRLSANGDTQARRVLFIQGMTDHFALAYDGLNRLKSVSGPLSESFALDGASNVTNRSGTVETYDNANRLTQDGATAQTWSNADRLTNRGSDTFGYDALDRMTSSNVGGTARTYTYNGDGLLQTRTGGVGASFLWDPSSAPSRELKQNSDNIVYGLGPLYVVKADATTVTFVRDGSKNVRAELNASGAVTTAFRYRAYGQLAQTTVGVPAYLGLASQVLDPSGLYYMRARWYDPTTGRFLARDPVRGDAGSPMTLNAYAYAAADPIRLSDPSGMRVADEEIDCASPTCGESLPVAPASARPQTSLLDDLNRMAAGALLDFTNAVLFGPTAEFDTGADGVEFVNNASGVMGTLTGIFNWGHGSTTFSANLVVSNDTPDTWRMTHERGHVEQAKRLGPLYLIGYASAWTLVPGIELASVLAGHGLMDLHTAHPYEWDATYRMGLGNTWR